MEIFVGNFSINHAPAMTEQHENVKQHAKARRNGGTRRNYDFGMDVSGSPFVMNYDAATQQSAEPVFHITPYLDCENCYMFLEAGFKILIEIESCFLGIPCGVAKLGELDSQNLKNILKLL